MIADSLPGWQPLGRIGSQQVSTDALGLQERLVVGAFGSCGNLRDPGYRSWRQDLLIPALQRRGIASRIYNPEVLEWNPADALIESINLARDKVLVVPVTNQTDSPASIMETGMAVLGGVLRGQHVIIWFDDIDAAPSVTRTARLLASSMLVAAEEQFPLFTIADSMDDMVNRAAMQMRDLVKQEEAGVRLSSRFELPVFGATLEPTIYLSGTSGTSRPQWIEQVRQIIGDRAVIQDSYRAHWTHDHIAIEQERKTNCQVQLVAITDETESIGALGELGPRAAYARLSGQAFGVYIERYDSEPNSATNRTRILALAHLKRLREDFPDLPIFVAESIEQLALFGLVEYCKYQQLQRAVLG